MKRESQIWPVRDTIKVGDLVVIPLKTRADIAFGKVTGDYQHRTGLPGGPFHARAVDWVKELPRSGECQILCVSRIPWLP